MKTRLLIALTLAVAVTASVFAIWPVVADAPWEDTVSVTESTDVLQCQGALDYRVAVLANPPTRAGTTGPPTRNPEVVTVTDQDLLIRLLNDAERQIDRFCSNADRRAWRAFLSNIYSTRDLFKNR